MEQLERISTWGSIPFGSSHLQVRHIVLWAGLAGWLLFTVPLTETNTITAFAFNVTFLIILLVVSSPTRSVSLQKVTSCFFAGGLALGLALTLTVLIDGTGTSGILHTNKVLRPLLLVPIEELFKLLPLAFILWQGRKFNNWTLGATDMLLMGAASGAGFAFAEDAYAHKIATSFQSVGFLLPGAEMIKGQISCGSAVWTALAAGTLGLAFLMRRQKQPSWMLLAPVGLVVSLLDHLCINFIQNDNTVAWLVQTLQVITGYGYVALALFAVTLASCIGLDLFVQLRSLPNAVEFKALTQKGTEGSPGRSMGLDIGLAPLVLRSLQVQTKIIAGNARTDCSHFVSQTG